MFPELWIFDTYSLMIFIGIIFCFLFVKVLFNKWGYKKGYYYSILILACISIMIGLLSASGVQWILNVLRGEPQEGGMTFYGGLIGGALTFIAGYFLFVKKEYKDMNFSKILYIAAPCITIAHGFGRIGCFMAGCCYGIETDSVFGVMFPFLDHKVYPTQLFEAFFLILSAIIFLLLSLKKWKCTFPCYLISYGIFRFLIEFIRGDERGGLDIFLSPAQVFSIVAILIGIGTFVYLIKFDKDEKPIEDSENNTVTQD